MMAKQTEESLAEDALARILGLAYSAANTNKETNAIVRDEGILRTALFGKGGAFGERYRTGKPTKRINQLEIGLTLVMPECNSGMMAFLEGGRGFIMYKEVDCGLRVSLHSSDGLDSYYFDLRHDTIKTMAEIATFSDPAYKVKK